MISGRRSKVDARNQEYHECYSVIFCNYYIYIYILIFEFDHGAFKLNYRIAQGDNRECY